MIFSQPQNSVHRCSSSFCVRSNRTIAIFTLGCLIEGPTEKGPLTAWSSVIPEIFKAVSVRREVSQALWETSILLIAGRGGTVAKALHYKSEGRWFDSRWCQWNFSLT